MATNLPGPVTQRNVDPVVAPVATLLDGAPRCEPKHSCGSTVYAAAPDLARGPGRLRCDAPDASSREISDGSDKGP